MSDSMKNMIVNMYKEKVENDAIPVRSYKSQIDEINNNINADYSYYTGFVANYKTYIENYNNVKSLYINQNVSTINYCLNNIIDYKNNYISILKSINENIKTYYDLVIQTLNYMKVYAYCISKTDSVVSDIDNYINKFPPLPQIPQ
jgi:hypothetical protein